MKAGIITIAAIILVLVFIYNYIQISQVYVNKPTIYTEKLLEDLRITQISDYHANRLIDSKKLLKKIEKFNPHLIVLTGDIIDTRTRDISTTLELIEKIMDINKNVYFVEGNHELGNPQGDKFILGLKEVGVVVLDNHKDTININNDFINVLGLSFLGTQEDYNNIIKGVNRENYTIFLAHAPDRIVSYRAGVEDLILSGHTHGGQVRLPVLGAMLAPGQGILPQYDKGIFRLKGTTLYIDSGLGNSLIPIRLLNRVQITNMTIKKLT